MVASFSQKPRTPKAARRAMPTSTRSRAGSHWVSAAVNVRRRARINIRWSVLNALRALWRTPKLRFATWGFQQKTLV